MMNRGSTLILLTILCATNLAWSAVPETVAVEGRLSSTGGVPITDGSYTLTFRLYNSATAKQALWEESAKLLVLSGQFSHALGSVKALTSKALDGAAWFSVSVAGDPVLPRTQLRSRRLPRAMSADGEDRRPGGRLRALSALKFGGDFNLAGGSIKAVFTATGDVLASSVGVELWAMAASSPASRSRRRVQERRGLRGQARRLGACAPGGGGQVLGGKITDVFTEAGGERPALVDPRQHRRGGHRSSHLRQGRGQVDPGEDQARQHGPVVGVDQAAAAQRQEGRAHCLRPLRRQGREEL